MSQAMQESQEGVTQRDLGLIFTALMMTMLLAALDQTTCPRPCPRSRVTSAGSANCRGS